MNAIELEIFRHLFASIAEEMGVALMRSAFSPNIKERRDYSCALFSPAGVGVAMGDHMPVHLGAMPMSVEAALSELGRLAPGDVACLNDPFRGGTHLPDVTAIAPVYADDGTTLLGYVASRALGRGRGYAGIHAPGTGDLRGGSPNSAGPTRPGRNDGDGCPPDDPGERPHTRRAER